MPGLQKMNKYLIPVAVCSLLVAVASFVKLNSNSKKKPKKAEKMQEQEHEDNSGMLEDRILYPTDISDEEQYSLIIKRPELNVNIDSLRYEIILNLNKGTNYEGVVKVKMLSYKKTGNKSNLYMDFNGRNVLYLAVNGRRLNEEEIFYHGHKILIKKDWLYKEENHIEIIFSNKYAFMGDGLTTYFPLDENNKYSLKGQMIYSRNGQRRIPKIFPCFNILNPCEVKLEVLHPDGFESFSNMPRSLMRMASKQDYPFYGFFFQANEKKLNRSFRLNTSGFMENNSSIRSYEEVVKTNTQFYQAKLGAIHQFFVLCSSIHEVRPSNPGMASKDFLIRYFTKQKNIRKAPPLLNIIHCQISQIATRIEKYKLERHIDLKCHHKIDIFFIDDVKAEGDFYIGSVLLNESTIERGVCDRRMFYLLCRAFVGMGLLSKSQSQLLSLRGNLKLQELTLQIFPECLDFIFAKQHEYEKIYKNCLNLLCKETSDEEYWFEEYFEKESRYFVEKINESKVSQNLYTLVKSLSKMTNEEFWTQFVASYPFLQANTSEILIKIGIREKGIPTLQAELNFAKDHFMKSKYYLKFYTNEEIQNNLKKFIQLGSHGIQKRIPFIKLKEKYLSYIDEKLENYLAIKPNRLEAKNLYQQFKRYNESRNFHHISALRRQVKRIKILAKENITEQHRTLECGLTGWKLLTKLKIYPEDEELSKLIKKFERMRDEVVVVE